MNTAVNKIAIALAAKSVQYVNMCYVRSDLIHFIERSNEKQSR